MIRFLGTRNWLIFCRREIRQQWNLEMYTDTLMHSLQEKRLQLISLGQFLCCFTQSFNPCSHPSALHSDNTEVANNFPFWRHFPTAVWVMALRSEPPDSLNSLELLWDGTARCTHGCPQQYWRVPAGKVKVVTKTQYSLSLNPARIRSWLPAQLLPVCQSLSTTRTKKCFLKTRKSS